MDSELGEFYEEIVACLIRYGKVKDQSARRRLDASKICECKDDLDRNLLFHETPYYWAMWWLHGSKDPAWHQDPLLWPSPEDYQIK